MEDKATEILITKSTAGKVGLWALKVLAIAIGIWFGHTLFGSYHSHDCKSSLRSLYLANVTYSADYGSLPPAYCESSSSTRWEDKGVSLIDLLSSYESISALHNYRANPKIFPQAIGGRWCMPDVTKLSRRDYLVCDGKRPDPSDINPSHFPVAYPHFKRCNEIYLDGSMHQSMK